MGSVILPELGSDFGLSEKSCAWRTIGEISPLFTRRYGVSEKILKLEDYANRLRDETKKIDAFKRELPLCMTLLRDAIVATEEELTHCRRSRAEPVLEEFIPLKKICEDEVDKVESRPEKEVSSMDKMNWMSSVQLCSPNTDLHSLKLSLKLDTNRNIKEEEMDEPVMDNLVQSSINKTWATPFVPFPGCTDFTVMLKGKEEKHELPIPALSLSTPEMKSSSERVNPISFSPKSCCSQSGTPPAVQPNSRAGQHQSSRKQRRCWSPDLHRQFINALKQLGGTQATPKQIRELMQVDGLTTDEVKSHLQKYRLHSRRLLEHSSSQLASLWLPKEQRKPSQLGSPDGPLLHLEASSGENVDEDDDKYEVPNWKVNIRLFNGGDE